MMRVIGRQQSNVICTSPQTFRIWLIALALLASACGAGKVQAQSGKLGAYTGTITVSGTETDPKVTYRASVKVSLPVSQRSMSSATAEFLAGEAPNATVLISQWDMSYKEKSADSDGKFSSWTCALAAPAEIPMTPTGVLNVDLKARKHSLSLTLLSTRDISFNCVNSRSGAYKKKQGVSLYIGTGAPGMQDEMQLPFTDEARLNASYTLMPAAGSKERGPIVQAWDLRLTR